MKVWMIAMCLCTAACNRAEEHAPASDAVDAEGASTGDVEEDEAGDELEFEDVAEAEADAPPASPEDQAKAKVEQAMAASRLALDAERLEVDTRKADLDSATAELDKRLATIADIERRLDERIGAGETARQRKAQRIGVLAKLILSMPPQSAAAMVEKMSDEDAQALVLQMSQENERKASKLLSAMPGERAAQLGQLYLDKDPKTLDAEPTAKEEAPALPPPEAAKAVEAPAKAEEADAPAEEGEAP